MKRAALIFALVGLGRLAAADAHPESPPHVDRFDLIGPKYKALQEFAATLFNPFKSQTMLAALARKETPNVTNDSIGEAMTKRGISGIVLSPDLAANRVVLGDEVFGVNDELTFPDPKQSEAAPLISGATIMLRAIRQENLELEIRADGEAPRTMTFPLHRFWTR